MQIAAANWATSAVALMLSFLLWYWTFVLPLDRAKSRAFRIARDAIVAIGDTQLLMATGITIASLIMIKAEGASSLYHIFIARCLTGVNIAGQGAAIIYGSGSRFNWDLRLGLMVAFIPLYLYWTAICIEEFEKFDYQTPHCFKNENFVGGRYTTWMKVDLMWMPPGYAVVLMQRFERSRDWVDGFDTHLRLWPVEIYKNVKDAHRAAGRRPTLVTKAVANIILISFYIFLALLYLALVILTFVAISPPSVLPFSQLFFFLWAVYDEITVWNSNAPSVVACPSGLPHVSLQSNQNPEHDWGFGQILPLLLLLLPILQISDLFTGMSSGSKFRSSWS